ncbi:MAG: hypothetical protein V1817_01985 [Candidatus Micrarchaeota archaeon]
MNYANRALKVRFIDAKLFQAFEELKAGKSEERKLAENITKAITELKKNAFCGIKISRKLWPTAYVRKYGVTNLWKYNLPEGWRLIYTIVGNEVEIISVILEWFDHPHYAKRFGYKKR